jgi:anti-anti-sigma factor
MDETTGRGPDVDGVAAVERHNGSVIVRLAGELDLHNSAEVREALRAVTTEEPVVLVVDLAAVEFVDSTALGVLIEARARLADRRSFRLAAPGLQVRRALEVSGLDRHLTVHDTVEAALAAPPA